MDEICLIIQYDASKLCAENIFTEDAPPYITNLRSYLRDDTHNQIGFFIRGTDHMEVNFQNLYTQLQQDRENEPSRAWYQQGPKRPIIQKGQYLKQQQRPTVERVPVAYTAYDWLDYMTRNGYASIYNFEHAKTIQEPLESTNHEMFFFELARGATRRIMFFLCLPPTDTETRLLPDDKLKISARKLRFSKSVCSPNIFSNSKKLIYRTMSYRGSTCKG